MITSFLGLGVAFSFLIWFFGGGPLAGIAADAHWDQFIPDLIVGLLTASAVGAALWLAQRAVSRTELRAQAHREWSAAKERLVSFLINHNFRRVVDELGEVGPIAGLTDVVDVLPLVEWESKLDDDRIANFRELARSLSETKAMGEHLDRALRLRVREMPRTSALGEAVIVAVACGPLIPGNTDEMTRRALGLSPADFVAAQAEARVLLDSHPANAVNAQTYTRYRKEAQEQYAAMRAQYGSPVQFFD